MTDPTITTLDGQPVTLWMVLALIVFLGSDSLLSILYVTIGKNATQRIVQWLDRWMG